MDVEQWRIDVAETLGKINTQLEENKLYIKNLHTKITCVDNKLSGNGGAGLLTRMELIERQHEQWETVRKSKVMWYYATTTAMLAVVVREMWCWFIVRR